MAMLFNAIIMITMIAADLAAGHLPLSFMQLAGLAIINIFAALPFCAIGLFIGMLATGSAAPGLVNLVYLPMMWLSGLFIPLPKSLQSAAPVWPAHHVLQLFAGRAGPTVGGRLVDAHRGARGVDPGPFGRCGPPPCASWLRLAAGQGNRFLTVAARYPPSRFRTIFGAATVRERFSSKRLSTRKTPSQKPTERFLPLSHQIGWRRRSTNPEPPS